jgi:hypothetical protein
VNQKALKKDLVDALREELLKTAAEAASETAAGDDAGEGGGAAAPATENAMAGFMSPAGKPSHVPAQPPSAEDGAAGAGHDEVPAGVAMVLSHTPAKAEEEPACASPAHAAAPADQGEANDAPQSPLAAAAPVMDVVCSPAPAPEQPPADEPAAAAATADAGVVAAVPPARRESEDQMSVVTSSSAYSTVQVSQSPPRPTTRHSVSHLFHVHVMFADLAHCRAGLACGCLCCPHCGGGGGGGEEAVEPGGGRRPHE